MLFFFVLGNTAQLCLAFWKKTFGRVVKTTFCNGVQKNDFGERFFFRKIFSFQLFSDFEQKLQVFCPKLPDVQVKYAV